MKPYDVNIATCRPLPEPDPDEEPLVAALEQAGLTTRLCAWDDPDVDWSNGRLTLIRSTWNYYRNRPAFLRWAEEVARVTRLYNPAGVVRWNSHKSYLLSLPLRGVPIVPTVIVERDMKVSLQEILDLEKWSRIVVKPAVSAGSFETHPMDGDALDEAIFERLLTIGDVLVQPYVESVDDYGERCLVFIDGTFSHCVRKHPRFAGQQERVTGPHEPTERELAVAGAAFDGVGLPLLYGRVDLVRDEDDEPLVAELEVLEPSLFLGFGDDALPRLVDAVARRLRSAID